MLAARPAAPPLPSGQVRSSARRGRGPLSSDREEARGLTETYVLKIDDDVFTARIVNGSLDASIGAVEDADPVETDMDTFFALANGELALQDAVASGVARAEGDPAAIDRCFRVLSIAPRVTAAA